METNAKPLAYPSFPESDHPNALIRKNKALNTTGIERLETRF